MVPCPCPCVVCTVHSTIEAYCFPVPVLVRVPGSGPVQCEWAIKLTQMSICGPWYFRPSNTSGAAYWGRETYPDVHLWTLVLPGLKHFRCSVLRVRDLPRCPSVDPGTSGPQTLPVLRAGSETYPYVYLWTLVLPALKHFRCSVLRERDLPICLSVDPSTSCPHTLPVQRTGGERLTLMSIWGPCTSNPQTLPVLRTEGERLTQMSICGPWYFWPSNTPGAAYWGQETYTDVYVWTPVLLALKHFRCSVLREWDLPICLSVDPDTSCPQTLPVLHPEGERDLPRCLSEDPGTSGPQTLPVLRTGDFRTTWTIPPRPWRSYQTRSLKNTRDG